MQRYRKSMICVTLVFLSTLCMCGCGSTGDVGNIFAGEAGPQATTITAYNEDPVVEEPTALETEPPAEEPEPEEESLPASELPQLNLEGNYMPAKPLDGIDPLNDKVVALTFDDGPHPERTDKLLQVLADNGVAATFFVLGERVELYPDVLQRTYDAGHEIGTHSYDHKDLMKLSLEQVISEQYGKTNDLIEGVLGVRTMIDRPPYGSMTDERAVELGRAQIMWTVDPEDWKEEYKSTDKLVDNIMNGTNTGLKVGDGAVILSHDIHQTTVDAYDAIIKTLLNEGYRFVTVTQMMQISELRGKDPGYKFNGAPAAGEIPAEGEAAVETDTPDGEAEGTPDGASDETE